FLKISIISLSSSCLFGEATLDGKWRGALGSVAFGLVF
ncbi:hypothetical protein GYH30_004416, partial [Glycine max]